ncbi:MAG TPA: hypothetical protein VG324_03740, partial [Blastocatellia bacterium]|nr:hypothetical protein [Blastocatellia bacterium]
VSTDDNEPRLGFLNVWKSVISTRQIKWNSDCKSKQLPLKLVPFFFEQYSSTSVTYSWPPASLPRRVATCFTST